LFQVLRVAWACSSGGLLTWCTRQEAVDKAERGSDEALDECDGVLWIWDRKDEDDSLEDWPSVVQDYSQKSNHPDCLQVEEGSDKSETGTWLSDWIEFETSLAGVSWDLSVSLGEIVESFEGAVLFFLSKVSVLRVFERILDGFAFASLVSDVVHVALKIGFSAYAG